MKQVVLVLMPVLFFIGALLTANSGNNLQKPDVPVLQTNNIPNQITQQVNPAPQLTNVEANTSSSKQDSNSQVSNTPENALKQIIYTSVSVCTDGSGTTAYLVGNTTQIQPIKSKSAQCAQVVAVIEGGTTYFGCANGSRIILDCDWFAQEIGNQNFGTNTNFGNSYVEDFQAPNISTFTCKETKIDQNLLLSPQGNICDLHNLVGNLNQMHS